MMIDSGDLDEWARCVDCDAIVNDLRIILCRSGNIRIPPEVQNADRQLGGSLSMWLAVHRQEVKHDRRTPVDTEKSATLGVPA